MSSKYALHHDHHADQVPPVRTISIPTKQRDATHSNSAFELDDVVDNGHSSHATKVWLSPGVFIDDRMATNGHQQPHLTWKQKWRSSPTNMAMSWWQQNQFLIITLTFHIVFIVLFGVFGQHSSLALPGGSTDTTNVNTKYPMFQDVHVMIFIGFGFLMTFLRRYGFSAVSINLMLSAFVIEWALILRGFLSEHFHEHTAFTLSVTELLVADFTAAVILISMGALLGKLSPTQYIVMAFIETTAAIVTEHIIVENFKVNDVGGSIVVHLFGAYFGLAASRALHKKVHVEHEHEGSVYHSDIFSMIGTLFLWVYWPSFNAAIAAPEDARHRAITNTYLSMVACTVTSFVISYIVDKRRRFNIIHIQNSTLAGGVAIGTCCNIILSPYHAMIVGSVAGLISVFGYTYLTPKMAEKLGVSDTCGVHNLHGMPGVLAGLFSVVFALIYDPADYKTSIQDIYPSWKNGRNQYSQALFQLAGVGTALAVSIISGFITGLPKLLFAKHVDLFAHFNKRLILKLSVWNQVRDRELYADTDYFNTPDDFDFNTRIVTRIDRIELAEHSPLAGGKDGGH